MTENFFNDLQENEQKYHAYYQCKMCGETFEDFDFSMNFFAKTSNKKLLSYTIHQCNDNQIGWAEFVGIKKDG